MTNIELVNDHILFSPEDNKFYFVFNPSNLKRTSDGGILIEEGSKVLDFGLVMERSGRPPTAEAVGTVINELLMLHIQGKFEDFL